MNWPLYLQSRCDLTAVLLLGVALGWLLRKGGTR